MARATPRPPRTSAASPRRVSAVQWGTVAEWIAGLGALSASLVALTVANRGAEIAREDRRARVRERRVAGIVALLAAAEHDQRASSSGKQLIWSVEGPAACWALWSVRSWFGLAWHFYCEEDQAWPEMLAEQGDLWPRMRREIVEALDQLEFQDAQPDPVKTPLRDLILGRLGLERRSQH
jgi:hypothetical protein